MATSKGKISDDAGSALRRADEGAGEVLVGNEQIANTYDDEDAEGRDQIKGPDSAQWPVENRDMRLRVNRAGEGGVEEDSQEGYIKGPDPAQHPERPWADQVGKLDPAAADRADDAALVNDEE